MYKNYRISNNSNIRTHYKNYCKILSAVIITAKKKLYYNKLILKSSNRTNTTWNIVKTITNKRMTPNNIEEMNVNNTLTSNPLQLLMLLTLIFYQ